MNQDSQLILIPINLSIEWYELYGKLFQNHSVKLCWYTVQIQVTHTVKT